MSGRKNNVVSLADMTAKKLDKELELEFYRNHLAGCVFILAEQSQFILLLY